MKARKICTVLVTLAALAHHASAQCQPAWSPIIDSFGAFTLEVYDEDGSGPGRESLFMGGNRSFITSNPMHLIRRWDGRRWTPLGLGLTGVNVDAIVAVHTSGVGSPPPGLYVGGQIIEAGGVEVRGVARWDGAQWNALPPGIEETVASLAMYDEDGSGPQEANLFLGGALRGSDKPGILRFDGQSFTKVGGSLVAWLPFLRPIVRTMTTFDDDGEGPRKPALYIGGTFKFAGGLFVDNLARWDGQNWESLGIGMGGVVQALAVFDADGDGPEPAMLYAGGGFSWAGKAQVSRLARWDGQRWSGIDGYRGGSVESLYVFDDDGDGPNKPALFIGGFITNAGGTSSVGVVKWDGLTWHSLDGGVGGISGANVRAFHEYDEDGDPLTPPGLYIGGIFFTAGSEWSPGFARWGCPLRTCYADCEASTGINTLDLFDFLCFQDSFVSGEAYACDCDTSTGLLVCDLFDFLCFQDAFVGGCN